MYQPWRYAWRALIWKISITSKGGGGGGEGEGGRGGGGVGEFEDSSLRAQSFRTLPLKTGVDVCVPFQVRNVELSVTLVVVWRNR